ncbi:hypothetical protein C943_03294 [Mariniradius saccharolyticus AK6]|uniref:Uncharacterized protein n=1 Tax=Mariniradius saccharolyticus AK6 TaxID=1239962 RepID=M7Y1I7_9BACT|nr:hypothetical protein C943_03294 [Mariniradius saccharolyticus AK6]
MWSYLVYRYDMANWRKIPYPPGVPRMSNPPSPPRKRKKRNK